MPETLHISEQRAQPRSAAIRWIAVAVITIIGFLMLCATSCAIRSPSRVAHASYQNLLSTIDTNGKIEPVEDFQAHSLAGGTVQKVYVVEGQHVRKNDLLMTMNADDARARLAQANEQVKGRAARAASRCRTAAPVRSRSISPTTSPPRSCRSGRHSAISPPPRSFSRAAQPPQTRSRPPSSVFSRHTTPSLR